jgi:tetratricopeptide (TPR) repeat protein
LPFAATRLQRDQPRPDAWRLFSSPEKRSVVLCLLLVAVSLAVYNPIIRNGFINFDDTQYILHNPHVTAGLTGETVKWSFSNFYQANWHPLTWISHALDYQLFHANPAGHHYVNVLLHACNAVLLFLLFQSATGFTWRSLMLAALFAFHPVNVESVAWAAERKNVLSMLFFLLALQAYGWYARKPAVGRYLTVAFLFVLGLMSKPQVITFPFLLLLWDYWPLGRYGSDSSLIGTMKPASPARSFPRLVLEKVPLFLLCCISAVITMKAQRAGGAIHSSSQYSFHLRFENAILSYSHYLRNACWPSKLSPFYPHPWDSIRLWQVAAAIAGLVLHYRRHRYLCVGWLWFLGTLVPMIGLVQVGEQSMADRYAYLPFLGLFLILCWGVPEWASEHHIPSSWLAISAALILSALGFLTHRQVGYWHDSLTLWSYALRVTPERSYLIHLQLGLAFDEQGRFDDAIPHLQAAIDPQDQRNAPLIHLGYGLYDQKHGHIQDAIEEYQTTIRTSKELEVMLDAYSNMASAYREIRDYEDARESFAAALKINPKHCMSLVGMGLLAQRGGDLPEAIRYYSLAMSYEPTDVGYILLAQAEAHAGEAAEAQAAATKAAQLTTDMDQARQSAATLLSY